MAALTPLCCCAALGALSPLLAPIVVVKGHARLEITAVEREIDAVIARGELRDADLATGLAGKSIAGKLVAADARAVASARTEPGGVFALRFAAAPQSPAELTVSFAGDEGFLPTSAAPVAVEAQRMTVSLQLRAPASIDPANRHAGTDAPTAAPDLSVQAFAAGQPVALPVEITEQTGRVLGRVTTPGRLPLQAAELGAPGMQKFTARFDGDETYAPAQASVESLIVTATAVTLRSDERRVRSDGQIAVGGDVRDDGGPGGPIAGARVLIYVRGNAQASAVSQADGTFAARIDANTLLPGRAEIHARVEPDVPWRAAGRSNAIFVEVEAAQRHDRAWFVAITLGAAAILLLLAGRLVRLARAARHALFDAMRTRPPIIGLQWAGEASSDDAQRRRSERPTREDHGVELLVWDAFDDRPVHTAHVSIKGTRDLIPSSPNPSTFEIGLVSPYFAEEVPSGEYDLVVRAPGYANFQTVISIPHDGRLRGARVGLVSLRALAFEKYRTLTRALLGQQWNMRTPAEAAAQAPAVAAACERFADLYYGRDPIDEAALETLT